MDNFIIKEAVDHLVGLLVSGRAQRVILPPGLTLIAHKEFMEKQQAEQDALVKANAFHQTAYSQSLTMTL